ncbi:MAG TPA: dipeptide epimerase [Capsulimonadaceae bacterium]|jgi:L-alanine-DL-glutamate epimerase-like enolase superfamily enzyme
MPEYHTILDARPWTLPLRAPFKIAKRTAHEAQNVLVTFTNGDGLVGYGAAAPAAYVTGETIESVLDLVNGQALALANLDPSRIGPLLDLCAEAFADAPSARAAVEMAALDLWAKHHKSNLWHHFGARRTSIATDLTIPIVEPAEATRLVQAAVKDGFEHFKIKVGGPEGHDADIARIRAIVNAAPDAGIRVDANQGFDAEGAIRLAKELVEVAPNIELLEQPVSEEDTAALKYVRDHVSIPIFADEAAQTPASVRRLIKEEAVDGINIKLMKSGIGGALEIIAICHAAGVKLMLGCMLESRLSLTAALFIAAGTGAISYIDLDSHYLICPDPKRSGGFDERGPEMIVNTNGHGWGVTGLADCAN